MGTLDVGTRMWVTVAAAAGTPRAWHKPDCERRSWERGSEGEGEEDGGLEEPPACCGVTADWLVPFTVRPDILGLVVLE